ncbi:hypothetical protein GN958_ATG13426 [Phytophthora infestans]|uniref:Reverse transcriptase Ty1/copia-type domain-containing protein n=1 Tax=Phytophthora infestans TaxID=4787 RepID=A0A8S9UDM9_PHYIN|nr:hypothetical protein GN958_ATG13426 [Phytophthora infestans]
MVDAKQPAEFEEGELGLVWLLRKALDGSNQNGRELIDELDGFPRELKFEPIITDPCANQHPKNKMMKILIYVDDILIIIEKAAKLRRS